MFDHFTAIGQPGQYKLHFPISELPEIIAIFNGICSPIEISITHAIKHRHAPIVNAVKLTSQSLKLYLRGNCYAAI